MRVRRLLLHNYRDFSDIIYERHAQWIFFLLAKQNIIVHKYENNAIERDNAVTFPEKRRIALAFVTLKHAGAIFRIPES